MIDTDRGNLKTSKPARTWNVGMILVVVTAVLGAALIGYTVGGGLRADPGQEFSDAVMKAWQTGDVADIEAAYDPEVTMVLTYPGAGPSEVLAESRDELTGVIDGAIGFGNTYRQIGPVSSYTASDGDVYVSALVEVVGPGHVQGVPVVGFYRIHDDKVIRHVFMDAEHY